jgi:hypothetical protein
MIKANILFVEILLAVLTARERIFQLKAAQPFIRVTGVSNSTQLLLLLTITFGIAALFRSYAFYSSGPVNAYPLKQGPTSASAFTDASFFSHTQCLSPAIAVKSSTEYPAKHDSN